MMKKIKKNHIFLMLIMLFSFTACKDKNSPIGDVIDTNKVSEEPVVFSFWYSGSFNANFKSLLKMEELTNVSLDVTAIPDSSYDTKTQLLINTGENMPDLISKAKPRAEQVLSGVLLPISDYYNQMPNFMEFIEKNDLQYLIDNARQSDGKVYELPINTKEVNTSSKQMFIRKDIFDKHHIPYPTTYNELYESTKKLKEIYPDSQPIQVIYGNGNLLDMISPSFGASAGWGRGIDGFHYIEERDEWIFSPASDEYKMMLTYLHRLYAEGLLNQEYMTFSSDAYAKNASDDVAFVLMAEWLGAEKDYTTALRESGNMDAEWIPIYPLEGPAGAYLSRVGNSTQTMVVSAAVKKKEYFNELIRWLDWMYSEEAIDLFAWGIEGETYAIDADGNKVYNSELQSSSQSEGIVKDEYGVRNNCFTFVFPYDEELARMEDRYKELIEQESIGKAIAPSEPSIPLSEEDVKIQILYSPNLNDYVSEMEAKFIMGSVSFDKWDEFVNECNYRGAEILRELYNQAWQTKKEKMR